MSAWWAVSSATARRTRLGDHPPDVGVGDVLAARERAQIDRAVRLGPVEPARHRVGHARAGAAAHGHRELLLAHGAEPLEQSDVDFLAAAEVVVHEPPRDSGGVAMSSTDTSS